MKAILIRAHGASDQMRLEELPTPVLGKGQVLVRVAAAGVNFMDTGVVSGALQLEPLPLTPGVEGIGRIVALGDGPEEFRVGDRVAWLFAPHSYAEQIAIDVARLVPVPDFVDDASAAGLLMQGITASHFTSESYAIRPGDVALVHAAAGGVGLMLVQIIKLLGGTVIGRVSTEAKAAVAKAAGADHVIVGNDNFADEVLRLTDGEGVHVVYDGAGGDTFQGSLHSLRYHGVLVCFGPLMGRMPLIDVYTLPKSILITYATVGDHVRTRDALLERSAKLFDWVAAGKLKVTIGHRYPLADAAQAHSDLMGRRTTGKLLLVPEYDGGPSHA
ncbi:quinone oxidoreductase family protein [Sphingomonas sp. PAMC 26605]|uniref:quinone oxidoreductase family protein n=1 Tax=Sphingomonas sp. PAMC 26605 TaxID=1112214 RepID=UPI000498046F|nr:quinone oxidoreductase [Sphingomonas sp. PAMC 26605]